MKKYRILTISIALVLFYGCMDVLDKRDLNVVDDLIWEDENMATMYINRLYETNMPEMSLAEHAALCDEMYSSSESTANLNYGIYSSDNIDAVKTAHHQRYSLHKENYADIRSINIAIDGLGGSSLSDSIKGRIKAQALFLRSYRYWQMIKMIGGVPMVMTAQNPYTDELGAARSSTSECIQILVDDLDEAIEYLPYDWSLDDDKGRVTKGAVAAFKGRILLTWASPLFNPDNDLSRWEKAYEANKQAIEFLAQMDTPRELHPDFATIFTADVLSNTEAIIYRRYDAAVNSDYSNKWEKEVRPVSGNGDAGKNPTWELVKAFPMANGKFIEEAGSGYDSTLYWQNRDPRFYATIAYNNCSWPMNGRSIDQVWTYTYNTFENKRSPGTGFYNRKATDPTIPIENVSQVSTTWHELRYAEVLMNFAEAANEINKTEEAITELIKIRERAGIESGDGRYGIAAGISKEAMRALIMRERQVEFAFENKRYWDLRRRLMFQKDLGHGVKKLNGTQRHGILLKTKSQIRRPVKGGELDGFFMVDTIVYYNHVDFNDPASVSKYFTIEYKVMEGNINGTVQSINYPELYNFFAVPNAFLTSDTLKLEQNNGWLGGTFDPLK